MPSFSPSAKLQNFCSGKSVTLQLGCRNQTETYTEKKKEKCIYVLNKGKAVYFSLISSLEGAPDCGDNFNEMAYPGYQFQPELVISSKIKSNWNHWKVSGSIKSQQWYQLQLLWMPNRVLTIENCLDKHS